MRARETINKLEQVGSVEDALMAQLIEELREMKAAQHEIEELQRKSIEIRNLRTAAIVENAITAAEHAHGCSIHRFCTRPALRVVQ
jgi:dihydroxyacid dehydratase/phosphogluconate dehydratase